MGDAVAGFLVHMDAFIAFDSIQVGIRVTNLVKKKLAPHCLCCM